MTLRPDTRCGMLRFVTTNSYKVLGCKGQIKSNANPVDPHQGSVHKEHDSSKTPSIHVSEVRVLLIGKILESVNVSLVIGFSHTSRGSCITLLVEASQVEPEENDDEKQEDIASHVSAEGDKVSGLIVVSEDLRALHDVSLILEVDGDT